MKLILKRGTISKRIAIFVRDSSVTTGAGLTGLTSATSGLVAYYWKESDGAVAATAITIVAGTLGTYVTAVGGAGGGFIAKDGTNMPGWYEFCIPDLCLATTANNNWVCITLRGAANMAPVNIEIQLVDYDPNDSVRMGLSALPNAAAAANGGLMTCTVGNVLPANSISTTSMATGSINTSAMAAGAIHVTALAANSIHSTAIAPNAINAASIMDAAIDSATFAAGAINAAAVATGAIHATALATNSIHATAIAPNAINAASIMDAAIDNATFAADVTVDGSKLDLMTDAALAAINLDHLAKIAVDTDFGTTVHADSVIGHLANKTIGVTGYARLIHSLEGAYDATMSAAEVGDAVASRAVVGGGYGATTIGGVLATNLDAPVSGRATAAQLLSVPGTPIDNTGGKVLLQGTQTANITGNITGNLSGSVGSVTGAVGSVTGAVGSVTGNVGGNVVGTVASVTGNVGGNVAGTVASVTGAVGSVTGAIGSLAWKKNIARRLVFVMRDSTTHQPAAALSVTVQHSDDGTAFTGLPSTNTVHEISNGFYYVDLSTADMNYNVVALRFTAAGADDLPIVINTQP